MHVVTGIGDPACDVRFITGKFCNRNFIIQVVSLYMKSTGGLHILKFTPESLTFTVLADNKWNCMFQLPGKKEEHGQIIR